eukprot:16040547-Heterocapsa_arctica.AAC.1
MPPVGLRSSAEFGGKRLSRSSLGSEAPRPSIASWRVSKTRVGGWERRRSWANLPSEGTVPNPLSTWTAVTTGRAAS